MQLEQFLLAIKIQLKLLSVYLNILHSSEQLLTLCRMGFFGAAHGWGEKAPLPKIYYMYPTMMKHVAVISYLKKIKKYI